MIKPKILIAAPTSEHKLYCQEDWIRNVCGFTYDNFDVAIVDNSTSGEGNASLIRETFRRINPGIDTYILYREPKSNMRTTLLDCSVALRDQFLCSPKNYTHFFSLETDIFPEPECMEILLSHDKPVVSFPYFHMDGEGTFLMNSYVTKKGGLLWSDYEPREMSFLNCTGKLIRAYQNGLGCMLIRRDVIESTPFRLVDNWLDVGYPDSFFHMDLLRKNIPVFMDTRFIPEHRNGYKNWAKIHEVTPIK
jgi:hypothetical protein